MLAVFLLETLQTALSGTDLYHWFVSGFGNMDRLNAPHLSAFDVPIIGSIVSLVVQFFFVFRIWVLSRKTSWPLCFTICLVSRWYKSRTNILFPTLSSFQVSTLDAIAAFGGGVYVSLVRPELLFPIWLMSAGTPTREVRHWPGAKNCCVGGTTISEKFPHHSNHNVQTWLGGNTITDLLITGSMLYYVKYRQFDHRISL